MRSSELLNILFLDSWFADRARGSGSAVAITGLAGGLRALGHRVTILRPRLPLGLPDLTRISANIGYRFRVRRLDPDLIVGFDFDGCLLGQPGCRYAVALKGVMADELEYESGWNRIRFRILTRLERRNARSADRVVLTSQHSRRVATERYGLDPTRTRIVPEGIDVATWTQASSKHDREGALPTILSVGRQYRRKNTESLLRSMVE
ncbi:MAG: glycosyltransferase family 4 protein, partial [Gemmatimonadetes bacterium]|nr:glycosyltransferase family 4 protein [Gemmatimonadota bacterium]